MKRKISALTLLSMALMFSNLGIQVVIAAALGAGPERDVLFVAMSVPLFLNTLMLGSLGVMVTPAILNRPSGAAQRRTASRLLGISFGGACLLGGGFYIGRDALTGLLAPGFDASQRLLTAELGLSCLAMIPIQAASAILQGYWIAREKVFLPSMALLSGNSVALAFLLSAGGALTALSAATAIFGSSAVCLGALLVAYLTEPTSPEAPAGPDPAATLNVYAQLGPLLLSNLLGRSNSLVERRLASSLNPGTLSCLSYAGYLLAFLVNATTAPAATAYYAQLCHQWNQGDLAGIRSFFYRGLRWVLLSSLGVAGIVALALEDSLRLVLPWTRLTSADVAELSLYARILMVGYIFLACASFSGRIFYAAGKFIQAAWLDCGGFGCYVVAAPLLLRLVGGTGLAWATSLYAFGLAVFTTMAMRRHFGITLGIEFWRPLGPALVGWMVALAAGILIKFGLDDRLSPGIAAAFASVVYGALATVSLTRAGRPQPS